MDKVVIIIPTYNEAAVIDKTINAVFDTCSTIQGKDIHLLVFDSNSSDNTQQVVQEAQIDYLNLHLLTEPNKTGLGSAYLQAMRYAMDSLAADIVVEFDADLSHQPKYIAGMLAMLDDCDVVVGSRYVSGGSIPQDWGWRRSGLSLLGNFIARCFLTWKYKDYTSGLRVTRRNTLKKALPQAFISTGYAYKLQLFWSLHRSGAHIKEYPIAFVDRFSGQSKLPANSVSESLKVLFVLLAHRLGMVSIK